MRLDAHQHFWRFTPADYPWMSAEMQVLKRDWPPDDLRPLLEEQRIDACIAVQARASEQRRTSSSCSPRSIRGSPAWSAGSTCVRTMSSSALHAGSLRKARIG